MQDLDSKLWFQGDSECRMSTRAQNIAHSSRIGALFFNQQESSCLSVGSGFVIHHSFEVRICLTSNTSYTAESLLSVHAALTLGRAIPI